LSSEIQIHAACLRRHAVSGLSFKIAGQPFAGVMAASAAAWFAACLDAKNRIDIADADSDYYSFV
jgi:hypothetical protein